MPKARCLLGSLVPITIGKREKLRKIHGQNYRKKPVTIEITGFLCGGEAGI
jgi:hypothetical protein